MKTRKALLYLALAATFALTGCRSTRTVAPIPPATETHDYTVMTFTGTVDGISVNGQVRMERNRVIWCSVSKFVELGRAMATPDSVWVQVPMLNRNQKGDYNDLSRVTHRRMSFADLQGILESDDAERRIAELAQELNLSVQVRITRREKADKLTFPFNK